MKDEKCVIMEVQNTSPNENFYHQQENDDQSSNKKTGTRRNLTRTAVALIVIGFIIYTIVDSQRDKNIARVTRDFLQWVEDNPTAGVFAFVGVYFIATVLFIPGSLLTLGSGFVFANVFGLGLGILMATFAVFVGASTGCIGAFLLGRYLLRGNMKSFANKYPVILAIDSALEHNGFRIVGLMRLSPIVPFNVINYILGITAVPLRDYIFACIGMLPGIIFFVFLGSSAGNLADSGSSGQGNRTVSIIVIVLGVVFGIAAV
jgi:uncharacterized membrane protein YdjX (TVP38/TMEM64 family)